MKILIFTSEDHLYANLLLRRVLGSGCIDDADITVWEQDWIIPGKSTAEGLMKYLRIAGPSYVFIQAMKQYIFKFLRFTSVILKRTDSSYYPYHKGFSDVSHEVYQNLKSETTQKRIRELQPDLILSLYSKEIIPEAILAIPSKGCINLHPALLPQGRGISPTFWGLAEKWERSGATLHTIDAGIDTGEILAQKEVSLESYTTEHSLYVDCTELGADLVEEYLKKKMNNEDVHSSQPKADIPETYHSIPTKKAVSTFRKNGCSFFQLEEFFPILKKTLLIGILTALTATLLLNIGNISALSRDEYGIMNHFNINDEEYYLSLIKHVSEGHNSMGSISLKEHSESSSAVTALPFIPGLLMRFFGMSFSSALLWMDVIMPFFVTLFFFFAIIGILRKPLLSIVATIVLLGVWHASLLNIINPKLVLITASAYFAILFSARKPRAHHFVMRGILLGSLPYTYPHHFLYFGAVELCDALRRLIGKEDRKQWLINLIWLSTASAVVLIPKLLQTLLGGENLGAKDQWHRLVIPSHLPADPKMQILLLLGIAALLWTRRMSRPNDRRPIDLLLVTLFAGSLVLNQSIFHGIDIMFGMHYRLLLNALLWLTLILCLTRCIRSTLITGSIIVLLLGYSVMNSSEGVSSVYQRRAEATAEFSVSDMKLVLDRLNQEPDDSIVLAPLSLANKIPIYTNHYTAFAGFSAFQGVQDAELAERFVLQNFIEPTDTLRADTTYPSVFGVHAGNLAARIRSWCRITSLFRKSVEECRIPIRSKIRQQDVLQDLDTMMTDSSPDLFISLLEKYNVDFIISKKDVPTSVMNKCAQPERIGEYMMYSCVNN